MHVRYGKGTQQGPNPVPNYPCVDDGEGCQFVAGPLPIDKDYTMDQLVALRRNLPAGMLEEYISASRPVKLQPPSPFLRGLRACRVC